MPLRLDVDGGVVEFDGFHLDERREIGESHSEGISVIQLQMRMNAQTQIRFHVLTNRVK